MVILPSKEYYSWGYLQTVTISDDHWTRTLTIYGGASLSLHYHEFRKETWCPIDSGLIGVINGQASIDLAAGVVYVVPQNVLHRLINPTAEPLRVVAVAEGIIDDDDIIRIYKHRS